MSERILRATHGSPNHPLIIGDLEIPCYVLANGKRVLHQRGMVSALGMARGSSSKGGGDRLAHFTSGKSIDAYVSDHLREVTTRPIKFRTPRGAEAYGYEATVLADICEAVLAARKDGVLQKQQLHIADRCEILVRGFARVGIIALVDEATGYQEIRDRQALQEILDKYLLKEHAKWAKRFPDEFYKLIFEMRGWRWRGMSVNRPSVVGKYTNDIIWSRLAPDILTELEKLNPKDESGRRKVKHHMFLTENIGHPRLQEHLHATMALMRASGKNWGNFTRSLQRAFPKINTNLELPFED